MQKFDPRGLTTAPFEMLVKLTYREICQVMGNNEDQPIIQVSENLALKVNEAMEMLFTINQVQPFVRGMADLGDTIITIIVSKDGSQVGFSAAIHVVCKKPTGDIYARIFRCMSKLHLASVPLNEAKGFVLAARMLEDLLPIIFINLTPTEIAELKIIVIGDNIPVQQCFKNPSPDTLIRNAIQKATTLFKALTEINKVKITIGFIEGKSNPADIGSKISKYPVKDGNSKLWRSGPDIYTQYEQLAKDVYCIFGENKVIFPNSINTRKTLPQFSPPGTSQSQEENLEREENNDLKQAITNEVAEVTYDPTIKNQSELTYIENLKVMQSNKLEDDLAVTNHEEDLTLSSTEVISSWKESIDNILTVNEKPIWTGQSLPGYIKNMRISQAF